MADGRNALNAALEAAARDLEQRESFRAFLNAVNAYVEKGVLTIEQAKLVVWEYGDKP